MGFYIGGRWGIDGIFPSPLKSAVYNRFLENPMCIGIETLKACNAHYILLGLQAKFVSVNYDLLHTEFCSSKCYFCNVNCTNACTDLNPYQLR